MKTKILIFLMMMLPVSLTAQITQVNVGTTANDGTGQTLRSAFQTVNANMVIISDSLKQLRDTTSLNDESPLWSDTLTYIATQNDLLNIEGGSGVTGKFYTLSGITDSTEGFPGAGDSLIIHSNFIGKDVRVWREGQYQQRHSTNGYYDGYRFNSTTGTLTFRPVFGSTEQVDIWATNTILWEALVPEGGAGGGGDPGEMLIDSLVAYWSLDEVSGTQVNDSYASYDGVTNATVNSAGLLGRAETFTRTSSHYAYFGTTVGDMSTDDFSVSFWIYKTAAVSNYQGLIGNWGSTPYWYITINDGDMLHCVCNFGGGNISTYSDANLPEDAWTHIVYTVDRSGSTTLYINGSAQADTDDVSAGVAVELNNNNTLSIGLAGGTTWYYNGLMDEILLTKGILTQAEVTALYNSGAGLGYPFTE